MTGLANLLLPLVFLLAADEEPPTPAERIAALKSECAAKRAKLGNWAKGKKLGTDARAQYLIAVHLDPDDRVARSRLGHRRGDDDRWDREREKTFEDGSGAREKHGAEMREREVALAREEAAAFASLGAALAGEGHGDLARPLLLRAFFLDPANEAAARGLGLAPVRCGFGVPDVAKQVRAAPVAKEAGIGGFMSQNLGVRTKVVGCGSVYAEALVGGKSLEELARLSDQAQRLTSLRFGLPLQGQGWVHLAVAGPQEQFHRLVDATGVQDPMRTMCKRVGSIRIFRPRHLIATFVGNAGDPGSAAPLFLHEVAENQLFWYGGNDVPAWLHEVVGLDTCLTLIGKAGQLCITWEESSGLREQGPLDDPAGWPALLLKRAATGRIARFEHMVTAKLTGLGREDVVTGLAYYRHLLLARRAGLSKYLLAFATEPDSIANFRAAFGIAPDEVTEELRTVLLGAPPELPVGKPAGR